MKCTVHDVDPKLGFIMKLAYQQRRSVRVSNRDDIKAVFIVMNDRILNP
jgi:hypothetical protein